MKNNKSRHQLLLVAAGALALAGCASTPAPKEKPDAVSQAVMSPFNDLNLVRNNIPEPLQAARRAPYGPPAAPGCAALAKEVAALDEALGPDLDRPSTPGNPSLIERGSDALGDAATGALKGAAEGIIPFRGWVRRLSGADKHMKEALAAIAAGTVRRAYLKGLGQAQGCAVPAAPAAASAPSA